MNTFESQGFRIAYDHDGDPITLLHRFASDRRSNWPLTGLTRHLRNAGYFKGAVLGCPGYR
ncbi:MAG: hypothetical protein WBM34_15645 [Woeseiaceae bacterium]|jgi:hypothetical protein